MNDLVWPRRNAKSEMEDSPVKETAESFQCPRQLSRGGSFRNYKASSKRTRLCLSLSFHLAQCLLGPSMLSQMAGDFFLAESCSVVHILRLIYPFIYQWALMFLPHLGFCKLYCNEHSGAYIFSNSCFHFGGINI